MKYFVLSFNLKKHETTKAPKAPQPMQRRCLLEKQTKSHRILEELRFTEAQVFAAVEQPGPFVPNLSSPFALAQQEIEVLRV